MTAGGNGDVRETLAGLALYRWLVCVRCEDDEAWSVALYDWDEARARRTADDIGRRALAAGRPLCVRVWPWSITAALPRALPAGEVLVGARERSKATWR